MNVIRKQMMVAAALGLALLGLCRAGFAMGLRTRFAEVSVERLKIGKTYSLQDTVNFPLRVTNTSDTPMDLSVQVVPPSTAGEYKEGFEPIPDTNWVHLQKSTFTVAPNMEAVTDVIVSIPNDESLLGRRFVVYLWSQTQNVGSTGVGVKSRLLLSISNAKPSDEELKQKFVRKKLANLNFSMAPMEVVMQDVPLGKDVPVREGDNDVTLVSPNKEPCTYRLTSVGAWETSITPQPGWKSALDPRWLTVGEATMKMNPYSITPMKLTVNIPNKPEFKDQRMMFLLRAEMLEQDIAAYAYMQIYVQTAK